jgi:hypothetical protein
VPTHHLAYGFAVVAVDSECADQRCDDGVGALQQSAERIDSRLDLAEQYHEVRLVIESIAKHSSIEYASSN